ncbi:PadR family transcriptional regulator, partial [Streptomyces sp. NPDC005009]
RHGYALAQEVVEISQGRVRLRTGTLYGALERLQAEGLVEQFSEERVEGRLRRTYTLTSHGRQALADEVRRLTATAREATRRLKKSAPIDPTGATA